MACGTAKATVNDGTVPLCGKCFKLAKGQGRGVKMTGKPTSSGKVRKASSASKSAS